MSPSKTNNQTLFAGQSCSYTAYHTLSQSNVSNEQHYHRDVFNLSEVLKLCF